MAKKFQVKLVTSQDGTTIEEVVSATENNGQVNVRGLKTRDRKIAFKNAMKDPTKFDKTNMGDPGHATVFLQSQGNDTLEFVYSEPFLVTISRDPDIIEDPSGPNEALTKKDNNQDVPWIFDVATANGNNPPQGEEFKAGPYKVNTNAPNQKYYKYSVLTKSGLAVDPDLVVEN
jgi:hypothetical protein